MSAGAAAEEPAVALADGQGIAAPVLAVDRDHVGMAGERDAAACPGAERGVEVGLVPGLVEQRRLDAEPSRWSRDEADQRQVGLPAGRVDSRRGAAPSRGWRAVRRARQSLGQCATGRQRPGYGGPAGGGKGSRIARRAAPRGRVIIRPGRHAACYQSARRAVAPRPAASSGATGVRLAAQRIALSRRFPLCCPLDVLRRAEDAYVDELYAAAPAHGATLIGGDLSAQLSRSQPRRRRSRQRAARRRPGPRRCGPRTGRAPVSAWCAAGRPARSRSTTASSRSTRSCRGSTATITPTIDVLDDACATRPCRKFGVVWHVNCHSMPSQRPRQEGGHCADFVLGDRDGTTCAPNSPSLSPGIARPRLHRSHQRVYKGVEIVKRHGRPAGTATACRSRSTARSTWTRRHWRRPRASPACKADITAMIRELRLRAFDRSAARRRTIRKRYGDRLAAGCIRSMSPKSIGVEAGRPLDADTRGGD